MNLVTDPWIPVVDPAAGRKRISLKELLCTPGPYQVSLRRDDLELAALQLAVCLTQVMLAPADLREAACRISSPLAGEEYDQAAKPFLDMFVVDHPETPFMQFPGAPASEETPVQKMFNGLPTGDGTATLFNSFGEISRACPACTALALFHQAGNCPNWSGKHRGGLRGGSPVTVFIHDQNLRRCVWKNVMNRDFTSQRFPEAPPSGDTPVWIRWWEPQKEYGAHDLSLLRGLFWQAVKIEMLWKAAVGVCDVCGLESETQAVGFKAWASHMCSVKGVWPHPFSARLLVKNEWRFVSYTTSDPAWTRLPALLSDSENHVPPLVLEHWRCLDSSSPLGLIMGGYQTNKAAILERRHDLTPLPAGWGENAQDLVGLLNIALEIRNAFRKKTYGLGKALGAENLPAEAVRLFHDRSESTIHAMLRELDFDSFGPARRELADTLIKLCWSILDELVEPYEHKPETFQKAATTRATLGKEFKKIKEGLS